MALNTKHFEILKELKKEDELQRIAEVFNQTERNIRYKIADLNESLGEEKIYIKKRKIYCLLDEQDIAALIKGMSENNYVYEQTERIHLLILETILQKDDFCLEEVAELLQMSKSTLRADIKVLNSKLAKMGIHLKQYNNKKAHLIYQNSDLSYYLAIFLYEYVNFDEGNRGVNFKKTNYFEKMVSERLSELYGDCLEENYQKIKHLDLPYTDETLNLLILLACILEKRSFNTGEMDVLNKKVLKETKEFKLLEKTFTHLTEMNIYFLTDYLLRISCDEKEVFLRHKNWVEIELGVYCLIKEFEKLMQVELVKNKRFIEDVLYYIKPLIYRSRKGIELKNSVLKEVKQIYGETFGYLKKAFRSFAEQLDLEVSDKEIAFLVPIFEVALRHQVKPTKKIVIVSNYKRNLTNFLIARLEEEFLVDVQRVLSLKQLEELEGEEFDLIVSTSTLDCLKGQYPICQVSPILRDEDVFNLESFELAQHDQKIPLEKLMQVIDSNLQINDMEREKLRQELVRSFPRNVVDESVREAQEDFEMKPELVIKADSFHWKDAVKKGGELLKKHKFVKKTYVDELTKKTEEESLIFFINEKTALFYTEPKDNVLETGFSLVKNKQALPLRGRKVKYFICLAPKGNSEDRNILFPMNDYFEAEDFEEKIAACLKSNTQKNNIKNV